MTKKETQDIIDLCELNVIEERIQSEGTEDNQREMQKAVDWKKRQVMDRLRYNLPPVDENVEKVHRERNFEPSE